MIDYEKLKLAHELAMNLNNYCIEIVLGVGDQAALFLRYTDDNGDNPMLAYIDSIDILITRLKELTQPKPKYEVGQKVFAVFPNYPVSLISELKITEININDPDVIYRTDGGGIAEAYVYPTREALIDAQIEYWESLKH